MTLPRAPNGERARAVVFVVVPFATVNGPPDGVLSRLPPDEIAFPSLRSSAVTANR